MNTDVQKTESRHFPGVITVNQTKAAMALLRWRESDLAEKAGCSRAWVQKFMRGDKVQPERIEAIQGAIEAAGVRPIDADAWGGEGARFI